VRKGPKWPKCERGGVRLAIAAVAVVCGARSFAAVGEWADDAPQWVLELVGARRHGVQGRFVAPHEATLRRTIQAFDAELLDAVICAWIAQQAGTKEDGAREAIAADGKVVRGAWRADGSQVHLLSAISHHTAVVLAQREIAAKTNEIPELAALLADLDLTGVVVTADALHTPARDRAPPGRRPTRPLRADGQRQPAAPVGRLPAGAVRPGQRLRARAHHLRPWARTHRTAHHPRRSHHRRVRDQFPPRSPGLRVRRDVGGLDGQRATKEIAHCITSLTPAQASTEKLAGYIRGHWQIENRLHWVRDVTYDEDRSQVRTGAGPHVMASLRNLAISALRLSGHANIAATLRWTARDPSRSLKILGIT